MSKNQPRGKKRTKQMNKRSSRCWAEGRHPWTRKQRKHDYSLYFRSLTSPWERLMRALQAGDASSAVKNDAITCLGWRKNKRGKNHCLFWKLFMLYYSLLLEETGVYTTCVHTHQLVCERRSGVRAGRSSQSISGSLTYFKCKVPIPGVSTHHCVTDCSWRRWVCVGVFSWKTQK